MSLIWPYRCSSSAFKVVLHPSCLKWPICVKQKKICQKEFCITNIYRLVDHKTLSYFLAVANLFLWPRALVTGNNGTDCQIFSQQIMVALSWTSQEILAHISLGIFPLKNRCHGNRKKPISWFQWQPKPEKNSSVYFTKLNIANSNWKN